MELTSGVSFAPPNPPSPASCCSRSSDLDQDVRLRAILDDTEAGLVSKCSLSSFTPASRDLLRLVRRCAACRLAVKTKMPDGFLAV